NCQVIGGRKRTSAGTLVGFAGHSYQGGSVQVRVRIVTSATKVRVGATVRVAASRLAFSGGEEFMKGLLIRPATLAICVSISSAPSLAQTAAEPAGELPQVEVIQKKAAPAKKA